MISPENIKRLNTVKTPAYILDEACIIRNLNMLSDFKSKSGCTLLIALKAFSSYHCFNLIESHVDGFTASSLNELKLGDEYIKKEAHIYAPGFKTAEIPDIAKRAKTVIFNSHSELNRHLSAFKQQNPNLQIGLRLNPEQSQVTTTLYNPCAPFSRFGVTQNEFQKEDLSKLDGILVHTLCGQGANELEAVVKALESKFSDCLHAVKWLDLGGGHSLSKPNYDHHKAIEIITGLREKYNLEVILEPGEAFVYDAGYLVAGVLDLLKNERNIAILDTSATTHMPDVLEMPYTPIITNAKSFGTTPHSYRLGGVTCLSGDVIGDYAFDAPLKVGDKLIFEDMAQYTIVKNTTFNGVELPDIGILRENGNIDIVKTFGYADFKGRL